MPPAINTLRSGVESLRIEVCNEPVRPTIEYVNGPDVGISVIRAT